MVMVSSGRDDDGNDEDVDLEWVSAHFIASFSRNVLIAAYWNRLKVNYHHKKTYGINFIVNGFELHPIPLCRVKYEKICTHDVIT